MILVIRFLLIFVCVKLILCKPQHLQEQATQYQLDPLNEAQNEALLKDPGKRTIGLSHRYAIGKHVGINSLGYKYLLGYGPLNVKYIPVLKPVTVLKPLQNKWKPMILKPVHQTEQGWKPVHQPEQGWKPVVVKPVHEQQPPVALRPAIPIQPLHNYFYFQTPISRPALVPHHPLLHVRKPDLPVLPLGAVFPSPVLQSPFGLQSVQFPLGLGMQVFPGHPGVQIPHHAQLGPEVLNQHPVHNFPIYPQFIPQLFQHGLHFNFPQPNLSVPFSGHQPPDHVVNHVYPQAQPELPIYHHLQPQPEFPHNVQPQPEFPHHVQPSPEFPHHVQPSPEFPHHVQPSSEFPHHHHHHHFQPSPPEFPLHHNHPSPELPDHHVNLQPPLHNPDHQHPPDNPIHHAHLQSNQNYFQQQEAPIQNLHHPTSVEFHGIPNFFTNNPLFQQQFSQNFQNVAPQQESFNPEASIQPGQTDLQLPIHLPEHPHFRQIYNLNAFQPIVNPNQRLSTGNVLRPSISLDTPITQEHAN